MTTLAAEYLAVYRQLVAEAAADRDPAPPSARRLIPRRRSA